MVRELLLELGYKNEDIDTAISAYNLFRYTEETLTRKINENYLFLFEFGFDKKDKTAIDIKKIDAHTYEISGGFIESVSRGIVVNDYESLSYFWKRLKNDGVIDMLKEKGIKDGDTVKIGKVDFEFVEYIRKNTYV